LPMNLPWVWVLRSRGAFGLLALGLGSLLLSPMSSHGKVFYAKDEALELAFPEADRVETRTFILSDAEHSRAERLARAPIDSKLFTLYAGWKDGQIVGYAAIESHTVRTMPESILVVLSPDGEVRSTVVLAFHEPLDYLPSNRWLRQFEGKGPPAELQPGRDIAGILGSTLTVQAVSQGVRKVLALFQILVQGRR